MSHEDWLIIFQLIRTRTARIQTVLADLRVRQGLAVALRPYHPCDRHQQTTLCKIANIVARWEVLLFSLLRIKPMTDLQEEIVDLFSYTNDKEIAMINIQIPDNDGSDPSLHIARAKVGAIAHYLEKFRSEAKLVDLLDAVQIILEKEQLKNEIPGANLNYALECLFEASHAIRYPEDWTVPRDWSVQKEKAVFNGNGRNGNDNGKVEHLDY